MLLLGVTLGLTSCDDYLDKEPESNVTPASFFTSADDLAAYTVNLYGVLTSIAPGSYGMSTFAYDNATDNQAGTDYSSRWVPGNWKVGQSGGAWDFGNIRSVNYFLDQVLPKFEAKQISGAEAHVRHYIGEAYFLRAYLYWTSCSLLAISLSCSQRFLMTRRLLLRLQSASHVIR